MKLLREFCGDIVALRKGDHSAERLKLERERLEFERQLAVPDLDKFCPAWAAKPENRKKLPRGPSLSPKEREARIRAIFGLGDPVKTSEESDLPDSKSSAPDAPTESK